MSSATSSYAQIAGRTKFFLVVGADISGYIVDGLYSVLNVDPAASSANRDGIVTGILAGTLLKDLGRQIVVYADTIPGSPHTAVYRQVLQVDGASSEGCVLPPAPFYVKVYDAAGAGVNVVRTG